MEWYLRAQKLASTKSVVFHKVPACSPWRGFQSIFLQRLSEWFDGGFHDFIEGVLEDSGRKIFCQLPMESVYFQLQQTRSHTF